MVWLLRALDAARTVSDGVTALRLVARLRYHARTLSYVGHMATGLLRLHDEWLASNPAIEAHDASKEV
jgi:hypothetical protein